MLNQLTKDEKDWIIDFAILEGYYVAHREYPEVNLEQLLYKLGATQEQIDNLGT